MSDAIATAVPPERAEFVERSHCIACDSTDLRALSSGRFDEGLLARLIDRDPWGEHPGPFLAGRTWCLVACRRCGMAFHRFVLDERWNQRRFERWMTREAIDAFELNSHAPGADFEIARGFTEHVLRIECATRTRRGAEPARVLDFGCGDGLFLALCDHYGLHGCGVDRSAARRSVGRSARIVSSLEEASHEGPFHAVTLFEVLEHLDDPRGVLARLRELLVDGGVLVLETPDCSGVVDIDSEDAYRKVHPLDHINAFTPATLVALAERVGFLATKTPSVCVASHPRAMVKRMVKVALGPLLRPTTRRYFAKR